MSYCLKENLERFAVPPSTLIVSETDAIFEGGFVGTLLEFRKLVTNKRIDTDSNYSCFHVSDYIKFPNGIIWNGMYLKDGAGCVHLRLMSKEEKEVYQRSGISAGTYKEFLAMRTEADGSSCGKLSAVDAIKRLERIGTEHSKTNQKLKEAARRYACHVFAIIESLNIASEYHKYSEENRPTELAEIGFQQHEEYFVIPLKHGFEITFACDATSTNGACKAYNSGAPIVERKYAPFDGFLYRVEDVHSSCYVVNYLNADIYLEDAMRLAKAVADGLLDDLVTKVESIFNRRIEEKKKCLDLLKNLPEFQLP